MAEYIERKAVEEIMQKHRCSDCTNEKSLDCPLCQLHRPFDEISKLPTADVVPKSEVEELSGKYEDLKLKYADLQKDKDELIAWGDDKKTEVAREIFEEFEKASNSTAFGILDSVNIFRDKIAELKKKYTEGEQRND